MNKWLFKKMRLAKDNRDHILKTKQKSDFKSLSLINKTPLHEAVENRDAASVEKLIHLIDSVNGNGSSPLHLAAEWGYSEIVEMLLSMGANKNLKNNYGHTPLDLANFGNKCFDLKKDLLFLQKDVNNSNKKCCNDIDEIISSSEDPKNIKELKKMNSQHYKIIEKAELQISTTANKINGTDYEATIRLLS